MAKAADKSTEKKQRARPRRDTGPSDLPSSWVPRGANLGPFDLPPLTPEQIEHREKQAAASKRLARYVDAMNRVAVGLPPAPTTPAASKTANPVKLVKSKDWILSLVKPWKKAGKINDRTTQETLSKIIADELSAERAAGVPVRALTQGYIRSHLADFGIWPISAIK
jgi:hypothetical protein